MRFAVFLVAAIAVNLAPPGAADPVPMPPQALDWQDDNGTVTLTWQPPFGSDAPTSYNIYRNGDLLRSVQTTSFVDTYTGIGFYAVTAKYAHIESPPVIAIIGILPCSPVVVATYNHPPWVAWGVHDECVPF